MRGVSGLDSHLLIIGASARAAAFSALRAGLQPRSVDLFADLDLQARCPVQRLTRNYPRGFEDVIRADLPGPWMYTGALENYPRLIGGWQQLRELWGVRSECLRWARDPVSIARVLGHHDLPCPRTLLQPPTEEGRRWLVKPLRGAGGAGIREWTAADSPPPGRVYWQEYIDGQPAAAIYLSPIWNHVFFLGLTRQLVGLPWLHAAPFQYCGSIGPVRTRGQLRDELEGLGKAVGIGLGPRLTGLFGVDGILAGGHFWPVEVNPRYTASVEVLEYATGRRHLALHRSAFDRGDYDMPKDATVTRGFVGKAILYAPHDLTFPADGPWLSELRSPMPLDVAPDFADIPAPGELIPRGRPVLTFFVCKATLDACEDALRVIADDLTRRLFPDLPAANEARSQATDARIVSSPDRFLPGRPNDGDPR
jgi:predicted ATP-grasp superfamily ATP-dependent carboligase